MELNLLFILNYGKGNIIFTESHKLEYYFHQNICLVV